LVGSLVSRRTPLGRYCLVAAALLLGCSRAPHAPGPSTPGQLSYYNGRHAKVVGQIWAEPDIRDSGANYVVAIRTVTLHGRTVPVSGRLELHTSRGQKLEYGDDVQLTGLLLAPTNSPDLNYRAIL